MRKMRNPDRICRKCGIKLIPEENWIPSMVRKKWCLCRQCFRTYSKKYNEKYFSQHRKEKFEKARKRNLERRHLYRDKILELLGSECNSPSCPIPKDKIDIRVLQIDHVKGNGNKERESFSTVLYYYKFVYEKLLKGSKDYQLLCPYCNVLKKIEKNEGFQRS